VQGGQKGEHQPPHIFRTEACAAMNAATGEKEWTSTGTIFQDRKGGGRPDKGISLGLERLLDKAPEFQAGTLQAKICLKSGN